MMAIGQKSTDPTDASWREPAGLLPTPQGRRAGLLKGFALFQEAADRSTHNTRAD